LVLIKLVALVHKDLPAPQALPEQLVQRVQQDQQVQLVRRAQLVRLVLHLL
jgi:hypothetical protein